MIKRILYFLLVIVVLFALTFSLHNYVLTTNLSYSLLKVYSFHAIAAIVVYISVEMLAAKLPSQAGAAYLVLMFFKIGIFILMFQESILTKESLTLAERIGLTIPLFVFLIVEAISVGKLLNSK